MKVDRERNCYNYREFGHITRHCRNWRFVELSQISHLLVVILELSDVSEVQHKDMMINR